MEYVRKFHLNHKNLQSVKFFAVFKLYINDFADVIKMLTQTNIFYCQSNLYSNARLNDAPHVQYKQVDSCSLKCHIVFELYVIALKKLILYKIEI